ncbi:MAG TPA: hypothetical protein VN442_01905 [Bryobacteraceae bacterium]|nr:hypothetical protein [Bryobacteraceae bacterium]
MPATTALFFDVGGVVLTNGWDRSARLRAAALDWDPFEQRHESVVADFETGRIELEDYLDRTVSMSGGCSRANNSGTSCWRNPAACPAALTVVEALARNKRCFMATLNNESLDLNRYRIERFQLRNYLDVFFSSCYCGLRKPDQRFYRLVLQITQRSRG